MALPRNAAQMPGTNPMKNVAGSICARTTSVIIMVLYFIIELISMPWTCRKRGSLLAYQVCFV